MIEEWIDNLTDLWGGVSDGKTGKVRAYSLFKRNEFPDALELGQPSALTFFEELTPEYSAGGPNLGFYNGVTDFHLTPDTNRRRLPYVFGFVGRIWRAAASQMQLGGKVEHFVVTKISLAVLQYGQEAQHFGLQVEWTVKESISGLVVSG